MQTINDNMVKGEPKIVARKILEVPETKRWLIEVPLKVYRFDSGRDPEGYRHLEESAKKSIEMMAESGNLCEVGIGSVYGYETKEGYVDGAALGFIRKNPRNKTNPMYHPWTWENGRELHVGKEGSNCRKEVADIISSEINFHRECDGYLYRYLSEFACQTDLEFEDIERGDNPFSLEKA